MKKVQSFSGWLRGGRHKPWAAVCPLPRADCPLLPLLQLAAFLRWQSPPTDACLPAYTISLFLPLAAVPGWEMVCRRGWQATESALASLSASTSGRGCHQRPASPGAERYTPSYTHTMAGAGTKYIFYVRNMCTLWPLNLLYMCEITSLAARGT